MGLAELKADAKLLREQYAQGEGDMDMRRELADNVLPLLMQILDGVIANDAEVRDEVADLGEAVDDLIDDTGDVLHPETTTKIVGVIEIGKLLAGELAALVVAKDANGKPKLDDLTRKRVAELVKTYRQGAEVVSAMLVEITMPVEPSTDTAEEPEDDEGDEDEEDNEEDDDELEGDEDEDEDEDEDDGMTGGV
jgi:hypothetical protein